VKTIVRIASPLVPQDSWGNDIRHSVSWGDERQPYPQFWSWSWSWVSGLALGRSWALFRCWVQSFGEKDGVW
jgi:hypothetical protein